MSDIAIIKKEEMQIILDFYLGIKEYGHIYCFPPERLNEPFNKILEGIDEVSQLMKESCEI